MDWTRPCSSPRSSGRRAGRVSGGPAAWWRSPTDALSRPGESGSRIVLSGRGLLPSALQLPVRDGTRLLGRVDFAWPEHRTLGEFDGRVKYGRLLRPGDDVTEVVYREKLREDLLRDLGWQVVRWTWPDL